MLAAHPEEAVSALFDAQGRTGTWSAALHDVLAADVEVLGITTPVNVVLPRPGRSCAGARKGGKVTVDGILLGPRDQTAMLVVIADSARREILAVAVEPQNLQMERRQGLDPGLGVYAVSGSTDRMTKLAEGDRADGWWEIAQAQGRLALCRQTVATLSVMIEQGGPRLGAGAIRPAGRDLPGRAAQAGRGPCRHDGRRLHYGHGLGERRPSPGCGNRQSGDRQGRRGHGGPHAAAAGRSRIHRGTPVPSLHEARGRP